MPRHSNPTQRRRPTPRHGMPRRGVAERRLWLASGTPQRSDATPRRSTIHNTTNFGVLFRFAIPLF